MPTRNNIILRKRAVPKRIKLLNGCVFYVKYERVKRANLPPNITVK